MNITRSCVCSLVVALAGTATTVVAGGSFEYVNEMGGAEANYTNLQFPASITVNVGANTGFIYGRIYHAGITEAPGANGLITAQIGFGPNGSNPLVDDSQWVWTNAVYNVSLGNDDEYRGSFNAPLVPGTYLYTYRFNLNPNDAANNVNWTLADLNGTGSNQGLEYEPGQLGILTVVPTPGSSLLAAVALLASARRRR